MVYSWNAVKLNLYMLDATSWAYAVSVHVLIHILIMQLCIMCLWCLSRPAHMSHVFYPPEIEVFYMYSILKRIQLNTHV